MKKGKYFYSKLSLSQKVNFKNEVLRVWKDAPDPMKYFKLQLEMKYVDLYTMLIGSFYFEDTKQCFEYWDRLSVRKIK